MELTDGFWKVLVDWDHASEANTCGERQCSIAEELGALLPSLLQLKPGLLPFDEDFIAAIHLLQMLSVKLVESLNALKKHENQVKNRSELDSLSLQETHAVFQHIKKVRAALRREDKSLETHLDVLSRECAAVAPKPEEDQPAESER